MTGQDMNAIAGRIGSDAEMGQLLAAMRPKLHRYCSRMTGSVFDGEDAVQEAIANALAASVDFSRLSNPEGWLFRIAQNASLDILRRRARRAEENLEGLEPASEEGGPLFAGSAELAIFMRLPIAQRSAVILKDVLGYTLDEICRITSSTLPSVKAALHRGRARLRTLADQVDQPAPALDPEQRSMLLRYIRHFNDGDFDALRNLLADQVKLDLVGRLRLEGRAEVQTYFGNYQQSGDVRLEAGWIEGRPAAIAYFGRQKDRPPYCILLNWDGGCLASIRDYRYAPYVMEEAAISVEDDIAERGSIGRPKEQNIARESRSS